MYQLFNFEKFFSPDFDNFSSTQQDLLTPDVIPGMAIGMGIFITGLALFTALKLKFRRNNEERITYFVDEMEPNANRVALETPANFTTLNRYTVIFRSLNTYRKLKSRLYMPSDIAFLREYIEFEHRDILHLDDHIESVYRQVNERIAFDSRNNVYTTIAYARDPQTMIPIDEAIDELNERIRKKMCLLRKLESVYLLYNPRYIRKPLYPGEEL